MPFVGIPSIATNLQISCTVVQRIVAAPSGAFPSLFLPVDLRLPILYPIGAKNRDGNRAGAK
jgi:hypothetical protein